uniref:Uncharacterized protein n=1 Tax=Saccharum hybrid cultivar R570 TaxID=131158 RepID=A0A059Q025_9POAL|nr:hypothetical protein SHCRBa_159_E04_F_30 [Saccharum hybrid cultivar R570]
MEQSAERRRKVAVLARANSAVFVLWALVVALQASSGSQCLPFHFADGAASGGAPRAALQASSLPFHFADGATSGGARRGSELQRAVAHHARRSRPPESSLPFHFAETPTGQRAAASGGARRGS